MSDLTLNIVILIAAAFPIGYGIYLLAQKSDIEEELIGLSLDNDMGIGSNEAPGKNDKMVELESKVAQLEAAVRMQKQPLSGSEISDTTSGSKKYQSKSISIPLLSYSFAGIERETLAAQSAIAGTMIASSNYKVVAYTKKDDTLFVSTPKLKTTSPVLSEQKRKGFGIRNRPDKFPIAQLTVRTEEPT